MKIIRMIRHGKEVFENKDIEGRREEESLCYHCNRRINDDTWECSIATQFYEICKAHGNALIMTRCEEYKKREI